MDVVWLQKDSQISKSREIAVVEKQDGEESVHFILKDHLGSWTTITDAEGNAEQELSFDAWGCFRDPETWTQWETPHTVTPMFDRGYTGHEHMTAFGLINMNGRCYDPLTSHFLSVDAYVQDPTNAQAFNRYAYCAYNPLRYTDPTGWSYCTGPGNGVNPNLNTGGSTMYHCDDPNDMLWGKTVHPCSSGEINGINYSSSGYTIGNGCVIGNVPPSHLRAIRAWQNNPCKETSQALEDLGITVNVGCIYGSVNDVEGFRASIYSWTDGAGQSYNAQVLDYVGGNENSWYSMTNKTPESYGNDNIRITSDMINIATLYTSIESVLHFSKPLGIFMDKQGSIRHFVGEPNKNLRKKMKYGKALSDKFKTAGRVLGGVGVVLSAVQFNQCNSDEEKIMCTFDIIIGSAGVAAPEFFGAYSTFWFLGGRQISKWYGEKVITPMIEEGLNPGLMIYQPLK